MSDASCPLKEEIGRLRKACALERRARYSDFQGKHKTFSQFVSQTAAQLSRLYPSQPGWAAVLSLFRRYAHLDVAARITAVRQVEALLVEEVASGGSPVGQLDRPQGSGHQNAGPAGSGRSGAGKRLQQAHDRGCRQEGEPDSVDVQSVAGVGPGNARKLAALNISTVADLLRHYPRCHLDFSNRILIGDLQPGQAATIFGSVKSVNAFQARSGKLSVVSVTIDDGTGTISVARFTGGRHNERVIAAARARYPVGAQVLVSGTTQADCFGRRLVLKGAEIEVVLKGAAGLDSITSIHAGRLVPVYGLAEGVS